MRHGGGSFLGWWKQGCCPRRRQRVVQKSIEGALLMQGEVWHLAVYASQDFISGQCRNIVLSERPNEGTCRTHELPLVIAPLFGSLLPRPWM
jgi:hypothetical protein